MFVFRLGCVHVCVCVCGECPEVNTAGRDSGREGAENGLSVVLVKL